MNDAPFFSGNLAYPSFATGLEEVAGVATGGGIFDRDTLADETIEDEGSLVGALSLLSYAY